MHEIKLIEDFYYMKCPHCNEDIIVHKNELNCKIFRHGVYKHNFEQINPHLNKEACIQLKLDDKVYGCAKPFQIIEQKNKYYIIICDYI